jgi:hypothetical protein
MSESKEKKKITIEATYYPRQNQYRLDGVRGGEMPKHRRNFESHAEMIEAVEKANPGCEVV